MEPGAPPRRRRGGSAAASVTFLLVLLAWLEPASAATFVVNSTADDPANPTLAGTLRAALTGAAATQTTNSITFDASLGAAAAISLGDPLPPFGPGPWQQLTIDGSLPGGPAGARAVVSAASTSRLSAPLSAANSALTLSNVVLQGITLAASSGVFVRATNVLFSGAGHDPGHALTVTDGATIVATDCNFEDNSGFDSADWTTAAGGAVLLLGADGATFRGCTFSRNTVPPAARFGSSGGAVFASGWQGNFALDSCTFSDNKSGEGGALAAWNGTGSLYVSRSTFDTNQAERGSGGAVALHNLARVSFLGSEFTGNSASEVSGALLADACPGLAVTDSRFRYNKAARQAGVSIARCPGANIRASSFLDNAAPSPDTTDKNSGGCLSIADTDGVAVSDSYFAYCRARNGGAIALVGTSNAVLSSLSFSYNTADVPVNDPPVVRNHTYTALDSTPLVVPAPGVLSGSNDVENDTLTVILVAGSGPNHGTLTLASDGGFTYTPDNGFLGSDSFQFTASDGHGGEATGAAFITVVSRNNAPYAIVDGVHITTGSPATTLYAYRNTPLLIPALGLLPSGQPSPPSTALFGDPKNDTMTLTMVSPPALGSVTVDRTTGAIAFTPPYMKKKDPDGLSTSMLLQAADTSGLVSPLLNVTIVIGGKPPLATPSINVFTMRLTGCTAGGVNIDAFSVTAGSLTLLDKKGQPTIKGVPTGMVVQVAPVGAPWPNDTSAAGGKKPRCIMKRPGKVAAEASRNWDYTSCQPCLACLKEMGYDCKTGPYKIRLQATARRNALWTDSAWSEPYVFQPTCEGKALTCYPIP